MPASPLARSPYAVLGVANDASDTELRRAYRRKLRETHPDTGGSAQHFDLVQRAWEQVGTPAARAAYDAGRGTRDAPARTWAPQAPPPRANASRPEARAYGHPGGWFRERYLELLGEWVGRGAAIPDPYDPQLIRSAPREIRRLLASAIAEEETAVELAALGIAFTVWHDVLADLRRPELGKIDHIVLGPTGLWALTSDDWGSAVSTRRGEVIGPDLARDERPMQYLAGLARAFERAARVRFSTLAIVVPDDASPEGVVKMGTVRGARTLLVQRPRLVDLVRARPEGLAFGGADLFEVRTRVQGAATFA